MYFGNRSNCKAYSWNGSEGKIKKYLQVFCLKLVWAVTFTDLDRRSKLGTGWGTCFKHVRLEMLTSKGKGGSQKRKPVAQG